MFPSYLLIAEKMIRASLKNSLPVLAVRLCLLSACFGTPAVAQQTPAPPDQIPAPSQAPTDSFYAPLSHPNESNFLQHLAADQKNILTSPFRLKPADAKWLAPVAGITAGLFVTDPDSSFAMKSAHSNALN